MYIQQFPLLSSTHPHIPLCALLGINQPTDSGRCCMSVCTGEAAARIEQLLLGSITSPQDASRLCAVQWANRLFPFKHVPAKYICTLAAGDAKLEIREEGQSGLKPPKPQPGACLSVRRPPSALAAVVPPEFLCCLSMARAVLLVMPDVIHPIWLLSASVDWSMLGQHNPRCQAAL